jgi:hypothetical protein
MQVNKSCCDVIIYLFADYEETFVVKVMYVCQNARSGISVDCPPSVGTGFLNDSDP